MTIIIKLLFLLREKFKIGQGQNSMWKLKKNIFRDLSEINNGYIIKIFISVVGNKKSRNMYNLFWHQNPFY